MTENNQTAEKYPNLSDSQLARIDSLTASRVVQHRSEGFAKAGGPDVTDLVSVAQFILTGQDPWAPENTKHTDHFEATNINSNTEETP